MTNQISLSVLFVSSTARCNTAVRADLLCGAAQENGRVIVVQQGYV